MALVVVAEVRHHAGPSVGDRTRWLLPPLVGLGAGIASLVLQRLLPIVLA